MTTISTILNRSVAETFYRQHAGAFLFLFFLLFGIQPSFSHILIIHHAFISGILTSASFFLAALLCWVVYGLKTIHFFRACLAKEAYDFIYDLNALKPQKRFLFLLRLNVLLIAPVACYGFIILFVAIRDHHAPMGLAVISIMSILCLSNTFAFYFLLQKAKALQQVTRKRTLFPLPKTLAVFVLKYVFGNQFITLLIIKLLSFTCLYYFVRTDATVFEERMLWLLYITALTGHSLLVYKNFHFIETELSFYRNLPVKRGFTFLSLLFVYTVILLPEAWALRGVMINQGNTPDYVWMILTGPALLLLFHSLLYTDDMKMDEFLKLLFGTWIVLVFFSLSGNHWILPAICLVFSAIVFGMSYYTYEKNTEIEGLE